MVRREIVNWVILLIILLLYIALLWSSRLCGVFYSLLHKPILVTLSEAKGLSRYWKREILRCAQNDILRQKSHLCNGLYIAIQ